MHLQSIILTIFLGGNLLETPHAYIDPNTGGMLFQLLAVIFAFFSGFLFFFSRQIKTAFTRMKRYLRRSGEQLSDEPNNKEETD